MPKGVRDLVRRRRRLAFETPLNTIQKPKSRRLPKGGPCPALKQTAGSAPVREHDGVRHRGPAGKHRAGRLDIGASVQQCIEDSHIIATGGPMEGRFRVLHSRGAYGRVRVRTRRD